MAKLSDTDPEVEKIHLEMLRHVPTWRKLEMVGQLNEMARALVLSQLRAQYPQASEEELRRHLADRLLGPELAALAYGPHSMSDGGKKENDEP